MSTAKYIVKRFIITVSLIFIVASALWLMFRSMPGSYVDIIAQSGAISDEQRVEIERSFGLHGPLHVQYYRYVMNMITLDFGQSYRFGTPVRELVVDRIFNSLILVIPAILTAYLVGSILGGYFGSNRGSKTEQGGIITVILFWTFPEFFLAILMIVIFAGYFDWFPVAGMLSPEVSLELENRYMMITKLDFWHHYTLPFVTIILRYLRLPTLVMRTSVVEVLGQDYLYYHRITGLNRSTRFKQLLRHASLPVVTLLPLSTSRGIGGLILVETVFNWPGIGRLLVDSVLAQDLPVIQLVFFLIAVWVILGNFLVDIGYTILDPRVTIGTDS